MADEIAPQPFTTTSPILTSVTFAEAGSGTGYITLYGTVTGAISEQGGYSTDTDSYELSEQQSGFLSLKIESEIEGADVFGDSEYVFVPPITWTFNLSPFQKSRTIQGTALIQHDFTGKHILGSIGTGVFIKLKYIIEKDGVEIASAFANAPLAVGNSYHIPFLVNLPITIPKTHFPRDSVLSLTIQGWGKNSTGGERSIAIVIGTDPANRDSDHITPSEEDDETTQLKLLIPFKS